GAKVAYWYSGSVPEELDPAQDILGELAEAPARKTKSKQGVSAQETYQAESRAAKALDAIRTGERPDLENLRYYAITLSANKGRVIVRDWMEGNFRELVENVNAWFDDLSIVGQFGKGIIKSFKLVKLLEATAREPSDVQAPVAAALWRCALKRMPIPYEVMAQTLKRVHVDIVTTDKDKKSLNSNLNHNRFALLKAFTIRCERVPSMTAELNEHETHPAYLCGRIMALLGSIQREALGEVGAGVVQRYYAAASATPALVLGRLIRTAQIAHLPKIQKERLRYWFENQLAELWSKMKEAPPRTLTLEEQTLFAMGYYHQLATRLKKDTSDSPEDQPESLESEVSRG
ncbi:type I-C CRISPR-associated protein Cas8c/Csd1, partial [Thermogutta sp.]